MLWQIWTHTHIFNTPEKKNTAEKLKVSGEWKTKKEVYLLIFFIFSSPKLHNKNRRQKSKPIKKFHNKHSFWNTQFMYIFLFDLLYDFQGLQILN